jgi:hypothetical protein
MRPWQGKDLCWGWSASVTYICASIYAGDGSASVQVLVTVPLFRLGMGLQLLDL